MEGTAAQGSAAPTTGQATSQPQSAGSQPRQSAPHHQGQGKQPEPAQPATADASQVPDGLEDVISPEEWAKLAKKKVAIKAGDQEEHEELERIVRDRQKFKGAEKRFEEAHRLRQEADRMTNEVKGLMQMVRDNPAEVLQKLGVNFRDVAEQYLKQTIEQEMMTPEQRQQAEMQRELEKYRQKDEQEKQSAEEQRHNAEIAKWKQHYDKTVSEALSSADLPKTELTVMLMGRQLRNAINNGDKNPNPADYIDAVRDAYFSEVQKYWGGLPPEKLLKLAGEETANKIRQADLARVRGTPPPPKQHVGPVTPAQPPKRLTEREFRAQTEQMVRGR